MSEKWVQFEEELAYSICTSIAQQVSEEYWEQLKSLLITNTKNDIFIDAINRVVWEH